MADGRLAGNREAFRELVERHQGRIYAHALGILGDPGEAEEAAQEAVVRAFEHLGELRDPVAFPAWFGTILARVASRHREAARRASALESDPRDRSAPEPRVAMEQEEAADSLWDAVRALSPDYRTAFLLVHLEGLSYREAAAQLGVPVSTVEGRIYKAKKILEEKVRRP